MNKLFTLGCSLTWNMGWKEILAEKLGYELTDSSMFAGSNSLQLRRIHSYIVNSQISKDDIIVWQITSQMRHSFSIHSIEWNDRLEDVVQDDESAKYYIDSPTNYFDKKIHRDILSNHPLITEASEYFDFNQSMEELVSTIILLSSKYKVLIFVGWDGALREECNNFARFTNLLEDNNVPHLKESFLTWTIKHRLPIADDIHPVQPASERYAERVLFPKLQELGWA